jgi:hypothetical protein
MRYVRFRPKADIAEIADSASTGMAQAFADSAQRHAFLEGEG